MGVFRYTFFCSGGCCDWHLNPHYWHGDARIDQRLEVHEWSVKHETDVAIDYIRNQAGWRDPQKPFPLEGGCRGVRTHRHTFVVERKRDRSEQHILHDNVEDPYQRRNLADDESAVVKGLTDELNAWLARTGDPWLAE